MPSRLTLRRMLGSVLAFAFCFALFYWANRLAADVRYPIAIFCFFLSVVCLGIGLCLLSRRLGEWFAGFVASVIEFFS